MAAGTRRVIFDLEIMTMRPVQSVSSTTPEKKNSSLSRH